MSEVTLPDRQKLARAFARLGPLGFYTDQGTQCCGSCTGAMLHEQMRENGVAPDNMRSVYWNEQSDEHAFGPRRGQTLRAALYLSWQTPDSDPAPIITALEREGLRAITPPDDSLSIMVVPPATRPHDYASDRPGLPTNCAICNLPYEGHPKRGRQ